MNLFRRNSLLRRLIRDLEEPILHGLFGVAWLVSLLVWGMTKIGGWRSEGLLKAYQPIFGTLYGLLLLAGVLVVLACNRRWSGILVMVASYLIWLLVSQIPLRTKPFHWDEFWALTPITGLVAIVLMLHYGFWNHQLSDDQREGSNGQ